MYFRMATMPLKPGMSSRYAEAVEALAIPALRGQKGFLEQMSLVTADGKQCIGITLWENEADADAYGRAAFAGVMKSLDEVAAGPFEVKSGPVTNCTIHKSALSHAT